MTAADCKYFVTYSGIKLPLKLVDQLEASALRNRNTYYRAQFDAAERIILCERIVYGEVDLSHKYQYHENGVLKQAEILSDENELKVLSFDQEGMPVTEII